MNLRTALYTVAVLAAGPTWAGGHATGDAAAGEKAYRQCQSCHELVADDGTEIVKGGNTGPNLWGLPGNAAAGVEGFKYKKSLLAAGEGGLVWDEANFVAYLKNPTAYLKEVTGDSKARSGMAFRVRKDEDALNIWAYIASVSPEPES